MKRVMIIGQPGSGKSTLARALGARTGLPVVHVDLIHWMPGWIERTRDEKTRLCLIEHAKPEWIFEGGHSATWPDRLSRCDTLIWLDVPVGVRLWRVLKRSARHYGAPRPDLPEGCPERIDPEFLRFIWRTRHTARAKCAEVYERAADGKARYRFRRLSEVAGFLETIAQD